MTDRPPVIARELPDAKFEPVHAGEHLAVLADVISLPAQQTPFGIKDQVKFVFEVEVENQVTGKRFQVRATFTNSLHKRAKLRDVLKTWRGRDFTGEELKGFDLSKLVGVTCRIITSEHVSKEERPYARIDAILRAPRGVQLPVRDYQRDMSTERTNPAQAVPPAPSPAPQPVPASPPAPSVSQPVEIVEDEIPF